jgi:hypothetical protein
MRHYLSVAKKDGITEQEVDAVRAIVMAVHAGRVRAQFREATAKQQGLESP